MDGVMVMSFGGVWVGMMVAVVEMRVAGVLVVIFGRVKGDGVRSNTGGLCTSGDF